MVLLESFIKSSAKAKLLNLLCLLCTITALAGCITVWAGELFTCEVSVGTRGKTVTWSFYQSYVNTDIDRYDFNGDVCDAFDFEFCTPCLRGGRAFLSLAVAAFLVLFALLLITGFRFMGGVSISALAHPSRSLVFELWGAVLATVLYGAAEIVWSLTCIRGARNFEPVQSDTWTGYAFFVAAGALMALQVVCLIIIRRDPSTHLGWQPSLRAAGMNAHFLEGHGSYEEEDAGFAADAKSGAGYGTHA